MSLTDQIKKSLKKAYEDEDSVESLGQVFLPQFESEITFAIEFNKNINPKLSIDSKMAKEIAYLFEQLNQKWMYELGVQNFREIIKITSYGMMTEELLKKHHGNEIEAHKEMFNLYDFGDFKDAMKLIQINISEDQTVENDLYSSIRFEIPWDLEHGLVFEFKNMVFQGIA